MEYENKMKIVFDAIPENESFARIVIASFIASINPTIDEIADIKTAVSEAVTNCVVHAYPNDKGIIEMEAKILPNKEIYISIVDFGIGIDDVEKALQPFYTTKKDSDRSGMGFTVMEGFMDRIDVESTVNKGVKVEMYKKIGDCKVV